MTKGAKKALGYEIRMFLETWRLLARLDENDTTVLHDAVFESALLHTRILADFLLSRGRAAGDIRLEDALPQFKIEQEHRISKLKETWGTQKKKGSPCWELNKKLVHFTDQRVARHDYSRFIKRVLPSMERLMLPLNVASLQKEM